MQTLSLIQPDDWHLHLRDGQVLQTVLPDTCRQMGRAIIMPNLVPPVTTLEAALAYKERILAARPAGSRFEPLMTLYLTDHTDVNEIKRAQSSGTVIAVKLYPAGATTHSDAGVTAMDKVMSVLEKMAELQMPLLVHGEVANSTVDIFDREARFIDAILDPLLQRIPSLPVVFEHITTIEAAHYVIASPYRLAATVTAHHLLLNRNALLSGGLRPHHYCLPVLKRERHRTALLKAVISGSPKFFLGTDSAPHARHYKEAICGCAGIYTAHNAIELYAEAFESEGALDRLEAFTSFNGPAFYGLPPNTERIVLRKEKHTVPTHLPLGTSEQLYPFRAGETLAWRLIRDNH